MNEDFLTVDKQILNWIAWVLSKMWDVACARLWDDFGLCMRELSADEARIWRPGLEYSEPIYLVYMPRESTVPSENSGSQESVDEIVRAALDQHMHCDAEAFAFLPLVQRILRTSKCLLMQISR